MAEAEAVECNALMTKERKKDDSKSRLYYRFRTGTLILSTDDTGKNGWISKPVGITDIRTHVHNTYTDSLFVPVENEGELKYVMTFTYYYYSVECTEQITDFFEILIVEYHVCSYFYLSLYLFYYIVCTIVLKV